MHLSHVCCPVVKATLSRYLDCSRSVFFWQYSANKSPTVVCDDARQKHHPLVVSVEVLELPLLGLLLSGLMWLFRLAAVELRVSVCKSLRVEAALTLLLLVWPVIYKVE